MEIRPITLREASTFINEHHRHHKATVGCMCVMGGQVELTGQELEIKGKPYQQK